MIEGFNIFFRRHWDAVLASVAACIFIYLFTRHSGIGISPDSVSYLSAADNISRHFSFTDFNGLALINFPRGYPSFLALLSRMSGVSTFQLAPVINAVLFCMVIILTSIMIDGYRNVSSVYKILFLSILACSPALLEVYSMLWSETLFIVWCLLFFIAARHYLCSHTILSLLLIGVIASLAFVTRYAGISIVATGAALIFFDGYTGWRKKITHLFLFGITAASLVSLNLFFNHKAAASLTGVREKALRTVGDNIGQIGAVISDWLPFLKNHATAAVIVFLVLFATGVLSFAYRIFQQQFYPSYETVIDCFFVSYFIFIITIASVSRFEDLSNRLLSPAYIPLMFVASSWIPGRIKRMRGFWKYVLLLFWLLVFIALQKQQYRLNAEAWEGIRDAGIPGYTENSWQRSPTVQYLRQHPDSLSTVLYSDANDAVFFLAGLHATPLPHKEIAQEIDELLRHPVLDVIWFDDGFNDDLIGIGLIQQHKKLVSVRRFEGGAIYHFADR